MTIRRASARVWFGLTVLVTGYLAVVALGPAGNEEYVYPFAALRLLPVLGILYVLAFRALVGDRRPESGRR